MLGRESKSGGARKGTGDPDFILRAMGSNIAWRDGISSAVRSGVIKIPVSPA